MRKKSNNIGEWFLLRSVGDESVDILFIVRNNSKSLPDELVCDSDHSEFSRFSVLPEPRIGLFAFPFISGGITLQRCGMRMAV